jgi:hypothetical protein
MPLQNRVTPFGDIVADPARGSMMGNRGILHDAQRRIRRRWAGRLWICCVLEWQGRRDPVMAPGHYTRLFFRDEPTALAAGHRPCAYCRRADYNKFRAAWAAGNPQHAQGPGGRLPLAADIDQVLHAERLGPGGTKRRHPAGLAALPDGTMLTLTEGDDRALLVWHGRLWAWSPGGYADAGPIKSRPIFTLTPPSLVAVLRAGYLPLPPILNGDRASVE